MQGNTNTTRPGHASGVKKLVGLATQIFGTHEMLRLGKKSHYIGYSTPKIAQKHLKIAKSRFFLIKMRIFYFLFKKTSLIKGFLLTAWEDLS